MLNEYWALHSFGNIRKVPYLLDLLLTNTGLTTTDLESRERGLGSAIERCLEIVLNHNLKELKVFEIYDTKHEIIAQNANYYLYGAMIESRIISINYWSGSILRPAQIQVNL
jgi:hypothetical protein